MPLLSCRAYDSLVVFGSLAGLELCAALVDVKMIGIPKSYIEVI